MLINQIPLRIPVSYGEVPKSIGKRVLEGVDAYFYLGGKKAVVIPGHVKEGAELVKLVDGSSSYLMTAVKVASYCTILIPTIMFVTKVILRSTYRFYTLSQQEEGREEKIKSFWEKHIASFKIAHGTTSLFLEHFKTHGISATYSPALDDIITRVRTVWKKHEHDILPRTNYFKWFEERYDNARSNQRIAFSFTADPVRQNEYITGERGFGGEWMREIGKFLYEVNQPNRLDLLTPEEKEIVLEIEELRQIMLSIPAMKVKIPYYMVRGGGKFRSLEAFQERVKKKCPEWEPPEKLDAYLHTKILPKLKTAREEVEDRYEIHVDKPVSPEHLEFELIDSHPGFNYPMLDFNTPQELSSSQLGRLQIHSATLRSNLEVYQDSLFEITPTSNHRYIVTRKERPFTQQETKAVQLAKKKFAMRKLWQQRFGLTPA